jgi:diacylglycerol kinase family enzyme
MRDIADGMLDLMVADRLSRAGIIGFIPHVLRGTTSDASGVTMVRTRRLVVETDEPLVVPCRWRNHRQSGEAARGGSAAGAVS